MQTLRKLWTLRLLISLSMILINATPALAQMQPKTEMILKGVPASFSGYLIPEYQFREMNEDLVERDFLKERLSQIPQCEESHTMRDLLIGFLTGAVAVLAAERIVR